MNREIHVRFWESAGVRFPCATQLLRGSAFCCFGFFCLHGSSYGTSGLSVVTRTWCVAFGCRLVSGLQCGWPGQPFQSVASV